MVPLITKPVADTTKIDRMLIAMRVTLIIMKARVDMVVGGKLIEG